ncbi:MAG: adenylyltransferase/cytidyltransferase family protein [Lachnospiraceae bacterium]|nr:adenylyltransferase/cytidyltransferase family protein [Lachnospiraceae bacterium]MCI9368896.1 adenylyltransferase/cytidyltransferase family protein [Lachnospiraceae bacterium]
MKKVITYGTYDLLHYGHIRLLERAKNLGDYLIVGVTADDFDKSRGKINVRQSLMERVEAVKATGLADEIIIEEYEGQKIDDIKRFEIDIFTIGSDWKGKFDYLKEYCEVIYLDRTEGISSSELRKKKSGLMLGLVGEALFLDKFIKESCYVNGVTVKGIYTPSVDLLSNQQRNLFIVTEDYDYLLKNVDAVFIYAHPKLRERQVRYALERGKHVLCESPVALNENKCRELFELAEAKGCILMEAMKTAYSTAFSRLILLAHGGKIGKIVSVDATCTSLRDMYEEGEAEIWNSLNKWGPTACLPIFQLLGTNYCEKKIISHFNENRKIDVFSKIDFLFREAVATVKVGIGVKSEGELIISGTQGYIYVPAPWWKTDYFEIRYENPAENKRYFYQLDGEGIRYEIVAFMRAIEKGKADFYIDKNVTYAIAKLMEDFENRKDFVQI